VVVPPLARAIETFHVPATALRAAVAVVDTDCAGDGDADAPEQPATASDTQSRK
jgi:hypothetical protein